MNIAYIITAYQDSQQLKRLIHALNYDADFFIHIDKKVDITPFIDSVKEFDNVLFTTNRFWINWGSFAQVLAQKELLRTLIDKKKDYQRVICLSGEDYPIWSNKKIQNEFTTNCKKQYIGGLNLSNTKNKYQLERVTVYHYFRDLHVKKRIVKQFFSGVSRNIMRLIPIRKQETVLINGNKSDVFMGSDYWALTYDCAKYVYNTMCKETALMNYFRYTFVPSEMCVQTIVFNSIYSFDALQSFEEYNGLPALTPLHYIIYHDAIKIFDASDYKTLINSDKMFFRKAKTGYSEELVSLIDHKRTDEENKLN